MFPVSYSLFAGFYSEVIMATQTYKQLTDKKYINQLREMQKKLPEFTNRFFIGIDQTTAPRTRLAYATDLKTFFEYLKLRKNKFFC